MDKIGSNSDPIRIGVLPIDGFALTSYAAVVEPLRAANLLSRRGLYDVIHVALTADGAKSSGAATIAAKAIVGDPLDVEILFVIAGGDPSSFTDETTFRWLGRLARAGVRLGGVSGGPVILARAGLMNGRRMTVHWEHATALAEIVPGLAIERSLYVIDRDRVTCAGGTAPMDLMLALIAQEHGNVFARLVSDWFLHGQIRPSGGPQRGGLVERVGTTSPVILDAVEAMESHIADPLSLTHLAALAGVTPRHLSRRFQEIMGRSAMAYYRELRLDKAQNLLSNSPLSLTEIALATGFSSSSHFSRSYSTYFGITPSHARS